MSTDNIPLPSTALKPEDIPRLFVEYWNLRRADYLSQLFEQDADFINVVGLWWENRDDIFKAHDYGLKVVFNNSDLSIIRLKTKMLADDLAIVYAKLKIVGQTTVKEVEAGTRRTIITFVVRRSGQGVWSAISGQNVDIVGGVETNIRREDGSLSSIDYR